MLWKYGSLNRLERLFPHPSIVLRQRIWFTEKRDGSCTCVYKNENGEVIIASRNMVVAETHMQNILKSTDEYPKLVELLDEHPDYFCFGELLSKGISPARFERHEKHEWIGFDIRSTNEVNLDEALPKTYNPHGWLTIPYMYQIYYQFGIPTPHVQNEFVPQTMDELMDAYDVMIQLAKDKGNLEGYVGKTTNGIFRFKCKVDVPKPPKLTVCDACFEGCGQTDEEKEACLKLNKPQLPALPDSEAFGAVDKVFQELSLEDFKNPAKAMPLVAQYINREKIKHLYDNPQMSYFQYYQVYLRDKI